MFVLFIVLIIDIRVREDEPTIGVIDEKSLNEILDICLNNSKCEEMCTNNRFSCTICLNKDKCVISIIGAGRASHPNTDICALKCETIDCYINCRNEYLKE